MVLAQPAELWAEPRSTEPPSLPALTNSDALCFGLRTRLIRGLRFPNISEHTRVVVEDVAGHSGVEDAFGLLADFTFTGGSLRRRRRAEDDNLVVPISIRESHESVFPHADVLSEVNVRALEEIANRRVSGTCHLTRIDGNFFVEKAFVACGQYVFARRPQQPHLLVAGMENRGHGNAASHAAVGNRPIRLYFFQRVANDRADNFRITEDEG